MQTLTAPVWLLAVLGVLAVCGFVAVCWVVAGWAERAWDWWRDRREPRSEDESGCGCCEDIGYHYGADPAACAQCGHQDSWHVRGWVDDLPPERTWEQMTSHQLPVVGARICGLPTILGGWDNPCNQPSGHDGPHLIVPRPVEDQAEASGRGALSAQRERRAPWWEAEQRQAYEALGFEFPSGLMARVRELAP